MLEIVYNLHLSFHLPEGTNIFKNRYLSLCDLHIDRLTFSNSESNSNFTLHPEQKTERPQLFLPAAESRKLSSFFEVASNHLTPGRSSVNSAYREKRMNEKLLRRQMSLLKQNHLLHRNKITALNRIRRAHRKSIDISS